MRWAGGIRIQALWALRPTLLSMSIIPLILSFGSAHRAGSRTTPLKSHIGYVADVTDDPFVLSAVSATSRSMHPDTAQWLAQTWLGAYTASLGANVS